MAQAGVFTPSEVAEYLRTDPATVQGLLDHGELVGFKVGDQWRIPEVALVKYLREQMEATQQEGLARAITDPRTWARALGDMPELRQRFEPGTFGAWVQAAMQAEEAEHTSENVVPFEKPRPR